MDDLLLVRPRQPPCHLLGDVRRLAGRQGSAGDLLPQRLPLVVGHGHEHPAVFRLVDLVDDADVGVLEAGDRPRLLEEARPRRGVARQLGGEQLEGDVAPEPHVLRPVDDAHPALADLLDDPVLGNGFTDHLSQLS
jgi:hypothetical protein